MARYGGEAKYGTDQYGGVPYGFAPSFVVSRIISRLSKFKGAGLVRTVKRLADNVNLDTPGQLDKALGEGAPAFLVAYAGGPIENYTADGWRRKLRARFSVICVANAHQGTSTRLEGSRHYTPGLDNLMLWATTFGWRALREMKTIKEVGPTEHRLLSFGGQRFVGAVDFEGSVIWQGRDDDGSITAVLKTLGLVHSPKPGSLFEPDNTTPRSTEADAVDGGVYTIKE